ncbi:MAG: SLC13 family permease [Planctomycetota bacterium]
MTLLFGALLVALIACLALEGRLHAKKSVIAGVFAVAGLLLAELFHLLPSAAVVGFGGQEIRLPLYIPPVNWEVIAIILGSSLFVDITSRSGLFTWIAIKLTKASGGDPRKLLVSYGVLTVVFSAVLNNVTAMVIVGSLSAVSLQKLGRREKLLGFLLIEGLLTNVGGLLTLVSSVPNIIVGNAAGITFVRFFLKTSPYVVVATAATLWLGAKLFRIEPLRGEEERARARQLVAGFDENDGIESRGFFWFGAAMTLCFIGVLATTSVLPYVRELGMGYVALAFACIMLVRYKAVADRFYRAVDWDLLGFFVGLFVFIGVVERAQVLHALGGGMQHLVGLGPTAGTASVLWGAALVSSVTDNIPLAAMLAHILAGLQTASDSPLWWSVVFGANLGGNLTPIGSASTLVAVTIMHMHKLPLTFGGFVRAAGVYALVQLALATAYVLLTA